jgi:restriction endonuclease S subunit
MQISGSYSPVGNDKSSPQSASIEQKIKQFEEQKRKIEQDLAKRSTNPDPKAAQGDNNANSAVNKKILEKIEAQISVLENRKEIVNQNNSSSETNNNDVTKLPQYPSKYIDIFA